jgi:hypothetical protein
MYLLKRELRKVKKSASPSPAFKRALWSKLQSDAVINHRRLHLRLVLVPVFAFVLFMSLGVGTYAYASPAVSEGHPLFRLKQGLEELERPFHRSPEGRAAFEERLKNRRQAEMQHRLRLLPPELQEEMRLRLEERQKAKAEAAAGTTTEESIIEN